MLFADIVFALLIALLFAFLFVPVLGWRRYGEPEGSGAGGALFFFFLIVFFGAWATSLYAEPVGPQLYGASWVVTLIAGLVISFILLAAVPPPRFRRNVEVTAPEADAAIGFGGFFWLLILSLPVFVALAYVG